MIIKNACMRTVTEEFTLANAGLGLAGECGEAVDILKKHLYHGHDLDRIVGLVMPLRISK